MSFRRIQGDLLHVATHPSNQIYGMLTTRLQIRALLGDHEARLADLLKFGQWFRVLL